MSFNGLPDNPVTGTVQNDGWWPDLDTGVFQDRYRLPAEYAKALVEEGIQLGMLWVNQQLKDWKTEQMSAGYNQLITVPAETVGSETEYSFLYRRAVSCHAKAVLLQQFATINRRDAASNPGKESEETEDKFLEFARDAIADFLKLPRIGVHDL